MSTSRLITVTPPSQQLRLPQPCREPNSSIPKCAIRAHLRLVKPTRSSLSVVNNYRAGHGSGTNQHSKTSLNGAFGDLGRQLDGTAAGLKAGTTDGSFTGFHKVEFDIWTRHDVGAAPQDADRLVALVGVLTRRKLARVLRAARRQERG